MNSTMIRTPNIVNFDSFRREKDHNPLFNLLTNDFDNAFLEKKLGDEFIINNYFVASRSGESVTHDKLFELWPTKPTIVKNVEELSNISSDPGMVYFLLGKKGIGKTIFLKYYLSKIFNKKDRNSINIYLDLKDKKSDKKFKDSLPSSMVNEIFLHLKRNNTLYADYLTKPDKIREIDDSYKYMDDNTLAKRVLNRKGEAIEFFLNWANNNNIKIFLIIDNIDDYSVSSIKSIVDKCVEIKSKFSAICIIALRDYWNPKSLKIDDANICSCYLGKPDVYEIVMKRLNSIDIEGITKKVYINFAGNEIILDKNDIKQTFEEISREAFKEKKDLHDFLYKLTNYNTREHLQNIYYFYHSPYLYSRPNFISSLIKKIKAKEPGYEIDEPRGIKYFDFLECFCAIHSLCFDIKASQIFNLFYHKWYYDGEYNYKNTLVFIRILQIAGNIPVKKAYIIENLKCIGYPEEAIRDAINILLEKALLESDDGLNEKDVEEVRISIKGSLYIAEIISSYSYLVFINDTVPMEDKYKVNIYEKFGNEKIPLERGNLQIKHESVRKFVDFVREEEREEEKLCPERCINTLQRIKGDKNIGTVLRFKIEATIRKMGWTEQSSAKRKGKIESIEFR